MLYEFRKSVEVRIVVKKHSKYLSELCTSNSNC